MHMAASFFFYDLETSGFDPKSARIMQFAGQRTDMELHPVGDPVNVLIRLAPDTLPDPDAVLVTGITPQETLEHGISEVAFLQQFYETVVVPDTIFLGFNSIRFDDGFMRFLNYRNLYDPYRWQWCDGCSKWDLLDVVRLTRALRPNGINWPFAPDGKPSNRLELLTSLNGLDHENAHDAGSDVAATIAVARLIRDKQPKLFQFLLDMRDKKKVAAFVSSGEPFIYTSGSYPAEYEKTTVVIKLADYENGQGAVVYDLREDPSQWVAKSAVELAAAMAWRPRNDPRPHVPVKVLHYNRCPAVAPLQVLDAASQERLHLDMEAVAENARKLQAQPDFAVAVREAMAASTARPQQGQLVTDEQTVDGQLYDGFMGDADRRRTERLHASTPGAINQFAGSFQDMRLNTLLPLYKARNYPESLTNAEQIVWEAFCRTRLTGGGENSRYAAYMARLKEILEMRNLTARQHQLLEGLRSYGESLIPVAVVPSAARSGELPVG
jgi:exodeoxyribonuclease-1